MKARELVDQLQKYDPDEEVIALVWYKDSFNFDEEEDKKLTDEGWKKVVDEFMDNGGLDGHDSAISTEISDSVSEHLEEVAQ
jgi:hypothetical protein